MSEVPNPGLNLDLLFLLVGFRLPHSEASQAAMGSPVRGERGWGHAGSPTQRGTRARRQPKLVTMQMKPFVTFPPPLPPRTPGRAEEPQIKSEL